MYIVLRFAFWDLSHTMYSLISFRKLTPPQNRQLFVYCYLSNIMLTVLWESLLSKTTMCQIRLGTFPACVRERSLR